VKTCRKCLVEKPLSDFYAHKDMADGHLNKCKCCTKLDLRISRATKPRVCRPRRSRAVFPKPVRVSKRIPNMKRICVTCGDEFEKHPYYVKKYGGKYCSIKCRTFIGENNPKWRGGRIVDKREGRVMVYKPGHPGARIMGGKYIYEYRLVAEQIVGRPLREDEIVHHINGDCTDNRVENLRVMSQSDHAKAHFSSGRFSGLQPECY